MVSPASRILSAISFGVFCRSAPSTSAIMRSRNVSPGLEVIRTMMTSRQHARATRYRRAVASGFADHRSRLARDCRLIHRGNAFDDLAVAGNHLSGDDAHLISDAELRAWNLFDVAAV